MNNLISVCIPSYNGASFIKKTIEMVCSQDYDNLEIVIIDDASTDNTVEIIRTIKDNRIRLLRNEKNLGIAGNFNRLLEEARGEYIMIICADDFLFPGALKAKAKILDENQDVVIVFSSSYVMDEKGQKLFYRRPFTGDQKIKNEKIQKELFINNNYFAEPSNNLIRRSASLKTGKFDTNLWYTIDWDYYLRLLNYGHAYYIDHPYEGFRISNTSLTGKNITNKQKILADEKIFTEKYRTGDIFPVTSDMLKKRNFNIRKRLFYKAVFMKLISIFGKRNKNCGKQEKS